MAHSVELQCIGRRAARGKGGIAGDDGLREGAAGDDGGGGVGGRRQVNGGRRQERLQLG